LKNLKVMFMGTPDIAVPCLEMLNEKYTVCGVVTQTDKPKGRGQKTAFPPVKEKALELGLTVYQPNTLKDGAFENVLKECNPDVIAVIAYGKILPKYILDYPKYGCINVHASMLPKYRGAAPIQWVIVDGETKTGITTMLMAEGLDTGDMLVRREIKITDEMTGGELHDIMMNMCPEVLFETIENIENITPEKQDDSLSCYAPLIDKNVCKINWNESAERIYNLVRGMNPFPSAYTYIDGKKLKIYKCIKGTNTGQAGTAIDTDNELTVACGDGSITVTELQLEGKKRMPAADFLRGYSIPKGTKLG
jgi:methionyl-tRNA formyltransferase